MSAAGWFQRTSLTTTAGERIDARAPAAGAAFVLLPAHCNCGPSCSTPSPQQAAEVQVQLAIVGAGSQEMPRVGWLFLVSCTTAHGHRGVPNAGGHARLGRTTPPGVTALVVQGATGVVSYVKVRPHPRPAGARSCPLGRQRCLLGTGDALLSLAVPGPCLSGVGPLGPRIALAPPDRRR